MLKCREANAGASAKECNGLGVATHCVGLLNGRFGDEERYFKMEKVDLVFEFGAQEAGSTLHK